MQGIIVYNKIKEGSLYLKFLIISKCYSKHPFIMNEIILVFWCAIILKPHQNTTMFAKYTFLYLIWNPIIKDNSKLLKGKSETFRESKWDIIFIKEKDLY